MKQISRMLLVSLLAVMLIMPLAAAMVNLSSVLNVFGVKDYAEKSDMIAAIMIWIVIFVGLSDLLIAFTPFSDWIAWVIGAALTIAFANMGFITMVFSWATNLLAIAGAAAVYWIIGLAILAIFGNIWAATMLMGIKARKETMKTVKGAKDVAAGIKGMKEINKALKS